MAARGKSRRRARLLVLGAGRHQTPLIARAEERGIEVVVADYLPDSPGKAFATHPTMVDAFDVQAVCELAQRYAVDGVITTGTDQPVVTMAEVAQRLGLPEIVSPRTARIATDKSRMKEVLVDAGVVMARFVAVRDARTAIPACGEMQLPFVVKPTDSQGQRATRRVDRREDLEPAVAAAVAESRRGEALVEEFVEGMEVTASVWVTDGALDVLMVTDRVTYNAPPAIGVAVQHVHPSHYAAPHLEEIAAILERVRAAYGVDRGPMYVQMIITPAGAVFVVEAAVRVGGGHEISLIPMVTGHDLRDRLIDLALTGSCEPLAHDDEERGSVPHALVNFLVARPGTIAAQLGMEELIADGVVAEGEFYRRVGDRQDIIEDGQGRVGYFITGAATRATLMARTRGAFERLSILGARGESLLFWPEEQYLRG